MPSDAQPSVTPSEPLLLRPADAARLLSISPATAKRIIGNGILPSVHIGAARRVLFTALQQFVEDLAAGRVSVDPRPPGPRTRAAGTAHGPVDALADSQVPRQEELPETGLEPQDRSGVVVKLPNR